MSDSDDDTYSSHPTDLLMLEKAQSLCQSAVQNPGIVPPTATIDPGVLSWLQRSKLVDVFGNGDICLSRDLMKHGTAVSGDDRKDNKARLYHIRGATGFAEFGLDASGRFS